jgi:hypothetical protein
VEDLVLLVELRLPWRTRTQCSRKNEVKRKSLLLIIDDREVRTVMKGKQVK